MKIKLDDLITEFNQLKDWNEILRLAKDLCKGDELEASKQLEKQMVEVTFFFDDSVLDTFDLEEKRSDDMKVTVATKLSIKALSHILNNNQPIIVKRNSKVGLFDNVNGYCQTMTSFYGYENIPASKLIGFELEGVNRRFCGYKLSDVLPIGKSYFG